MQMKTKNTSSQKKSKNLSFKNKVIINHDDLKEKLLNKLVSENEVFQSNNQYNQMLNILFDENKFKITNEFDGKHSNDFLYEKLKYLQPMDLDDSLSDDDQKIEYLNRLSSKFTFGHY